MVSILYDGWSLIYRPDSPGALHLLALLEQTPVEVEALVALPAEPPEWFPPAFPYGVESAEDNSRGRLKWEQRLLPRLFRKSGADLLHLTSMNPPLLASQSSVISPTGAFHQIVNRASLGIHDRFRRALGKGGISQVRAVFWPAGLPLPEAPLPARVVPLPMIVYSGFWPPEELSPSFSADIDLPETYILYHGPADRSALNRLLEAWSWASGSIGEYYPLLVLGAGPDARHYVNGLLEDRAASSVQFLPSLPPALVPHIYRASSAVFDPSPSAPWGGTLQFGLVSRLPVVAAETPLADALVGPAAYLLPASQARSLGAALVSVVVEEDLAESLSKAAELKASTWDETAFKPRLLEAYRSLIDRPT
jgi:hypothetical protein